MAASSCSLWRLIGVQASKPAPLRPAPDRRHRGEKT